MFTPLTQMHLHAFLCVPMLFGWDAYFIPRGTRYFAYVRGNGFLDLVTDAESAPSRRPARRTISSKARNGTPKRATTTLARRTILRRSAAGNLRIGHPRPRRSPMRISTIRRHSISTRWSGTIPRALPTSTATTPAGPRAGG
jgi:hypothetical protein